jgi:hypothetical protein
VIPSIILAGVAYILMMRIFFTFMWYAFKYEELSMVDEIFLLDDEKNRANIIGCLFFEEFEFESMKAYFISKCDKLHRCKSKLVKKLGWWWYLEMGEVEWKAKREDVFVCVNDIHTEKELNAFLSKEQAIRDPLDTVQYKIILIPNYKDGMGAMILKTHHCFTDGLGYATWMLAVSGEFSTDALPGMKPLPLWKKILIFLSYPWITAKAALGFIFLWKDSNAIKKGLPMTGKKNGAFTCDIDINQIKAYSKLK